jgi:uncharacterized small protein (DUF1192 family)
MGRIRRKHALPANAQWATGPLRNGRHERFCLFIVSGLNQTDAYVKAGYNPGSKVSASTNAYHLLKKPEISQRINALKAEIAAKSQQEAVELSRDAVVQMHLQCYQRALELDQIGNAVSALKEVSILKGYRIEQSQVVQTTSDLDQASDQTLIQLIFGNGAPDSVMIDPRRAAIGLLASERKPVVIDATESNGTACNETPDATESTGEDEDA